MIAEIGDIDLPVVARALTWISFSRNLRLVVSKLEHASLTFGVEVDALLFSERG